MTETDMKRRTLLKGIAVIACGCGTPQLLSAQEEPQRTKVPKEQAKYQSSPKNDMRCGNCQHFLPGSSSCRLVEGKVEESGYCILWAAKSG